MNINELRFWLDVLQWFATAAVGLYAWLATRQRVTADRIRQMETTLDGRLDNQQGRLATLEERVKHLPGHEDVGALRVQLETLHGDLRALQVETRGVRDELRPVTKAVERINEYLLNRTGS